MTYYKVKKLTRIPVFGLLVDENPRMRDKGVNVEGVAMRQHLVAHRLTLIVDPVDADIVAGRINKSHIGVVYIVDGSQYRPVFLALLPLHLRATTKPQCFSPTPLAKYFMAIIDDPICI